MQVLWTPAYTKICLANFLLFCSQYLLLPALPVVLASGLNLSIPSISFSYILMTVGMIIGGPFYAYLVDVFKRKYVNIVSWIVLVIITFIYPIIDTTNELIMLVLLHGLFFGIANMASVTLGIDLTISQNRNKSNIIYGWISRLGMITGIALGGSFYFMEDFTYIKYTSIVLSCLGIMLVLSTPIAFRAPIGLKLFSRDRFFMPRGFLPMMNLIILAVIPGTLFPLFHIDVQSILIYDLLIPYFMVALLGFIISIFIPVWLKNKESISYLVLLGAGAIFMSFILLVIDVNPLTQLISSLLMGIGLGLITPQLLKLFIRLSSHCERGSANMTHFLGWEMGISFGCFITSRQSFIQSVSSVFYLDLSLILIFIVYFFVVTFPFYQRQRLR